MQRQDEGDETVSIEMGRHAEPLGSPRISIDSALHGHRADADISGINKDDPSHLDFGPGFDGGDFDMGDVDLGLNFGDDIEAPVPRDITPSQHSQPHSQPHSPAGKCILEILDP